MGNVVESIIKTVYDGSGASKAAADFSKVAQAARGGEAGASAGASGWNKMAVAAGVAGAGVALAAYKISKAALQVGADLIRAASDAEEMRSKFNVVFREEAPRVVEELTKFGREVGRSSIELQGFAAGLQDTFVPMGFARSQAADLSVQVVKLATDLGSFNNLPTGDVVRDITSALVGETEPMRKYGVIINEAVIQNEALALGVWDGKGALDAQGKAAATLSVIMKGTADAQGDAARTSGSWANQMRRLESTVTDAKVALGEKLLPVMTPLLMQIGDLATEAVPLLTTAFEHVIPAIQDIVNFIAEIVHTGEDLIAWAEKNRKGVEAWREMRVEAEKTAPAFNDVTEAMRAAGATQDQVFDFSEALVQIFGQMDMTTGAVTLRNETLAAALEMVRGGSQAAGMELLTMAQRQALATRFTTASTDDIMRAYGGAIQTVTDATEVTSEYTETVAAADPTLADLAKSERELTFTTAAGVYWGKRHAEAINEKVEAIREAAEAEDEAARVADEARQEFEKAVAAAGASAITWGNYGRAARVAVPATSDLKRELFESALGYGASADAAAVLGVALGVLTADQAEAMLKTALLKTEVEKLAAGFAAGDMTLADVQAGLQAAISTVNGLSFEFDTATGSTTAFNEKTGETVGVMDGVNSTAGDMTQKLGEVAGAADTAAQKMDAAKGAAANLKGELETITSKTWQVKVQVTQEGSLGGGGDNVGRSDVSIRAGGGPFDAGRPMLVGDDPNKAGAWWERGYPELVVPSSSGMVVANDQLATAINVLSRNIGQHYGGGRNVTINFNGGQGDRTAPALQLMRSLVS